jgi:hypothetical protein
MATISTPPSTGPVGDHHGVRPQHLLYRRRQSRAVAPTKRLTVIFCSDDGCHLDDSRIRHFAIGDHLELRARRDAGSATSSQRKLPGTSNTAASPRSSCWRRHWRFPAAGYRPARLDAAASPPCSACPSTRSSPGSSAMTCISLPPDTAAARWRGPARCAPGP